MPNFEENELADLLIDVEALNNSMERIRSDTTPDHSKWGSFKQCAIDHRKLVERFVALTGKQMPYFDATNMKGWADTVWPVQKQIFDGVHAELAKMHGRLARQGQPVLTTGFDDLLHPVVRSSSVKHYHAGDFRNAVLDAVIAVFDLLRKKTGLTIDGDDLCNRAFSPGRPMLILSELETESGRNDQRGFLDLFKGFYRGVRNPKAHSLVHDLDTVKAGQYLVFASLLARRIDEAKVASEAISSHA